MISFQVLGRWMHTLRGGSGGSSDSREMGVKILLVPTCVAVYESMLKECTLMYPLLRPSEHVVLSPS